MRFSIFAAALIAPAAVLAFCKNEDMNLRAPNITNIKARQNLNTLGKRDMVYISMYTHIMMAAPPTEDHGPALAAQRETLNRNYAPWGFQFTDTKTVYYFQADWAKNADNLRPEKSSYARRGDYAALNIYIIEGEQAAYCFFPNDPSTGPIDQAALDNDGCFLGMNDGFSPNSGTVTHEVGHWLGLPHVFEGGCGGNDGCDDTVPQAEPSYSHQAVLGDLNSCSAAAKESCQPGIKDNVKNFMDYSDCCSEFTPCQGGRMLEAWSWRMGRALADGVTARLD